jgi:hypothetical protein
MWMQSLDQLLEEILRNVYRAWYTLPRRTTLPEVERLRAALATKLAGLPLPLNLDAYEQALIDFAAALRSLPGVEEAAGDLPAELAGAATTSQAGAYRNRPNTNAAPERVQQLVELLRLQNPPQALIAAMNYAPGQVGEVWEKLGLALGPRLEQLPAAEREQVEAIANQVMAESDAAVDILGRQAAYLKGLQALEQLPSVVRIAAPVFFSHKYVGEPPTYLDVSTDFFTHAHAAAALPPLEEATAAAAPPAPPTPAETRVPFFADVRFPAQVKRNEVQWLSVQLRLEQSADSRTQDVVSVAFEPAPPGQLPPPEFVEVRLLAPDFREETGVWERTMTVYASRDSQPVVFLLTSDVLGRKRITVDFYHKGRMIASIHFDTEVVQNATLRGGAPVTLGESLDMGELTAHPPPPADLELRVARTAESNGLSFVLNSSLPDVPVRSQPAGQIKLGSRDPQAFFSDRLQKLTDLARATPAAELNERLAQEVAALGEGLFELLLPPELQTLYWEQIQPLAAQGVIKTLLINSDEPWIPWELIKPYRWNDADDSEQSGPFLVEQFTLSRWLARPLPPGVNVKQAALVMPDLNLLHVQEERDFFATLAQQHSLQLQGPLQQYDEVIDSLRAGGFQLLHFATHGTFNAADAERSELHLGGQNLTPADLLGSDLRGVRSARPLVFLNACESGKEDLALVGAGGWAHKFFADGRASAFVGTLWEVSDDLAADFSRLFYSGLVEGKTLGEALRAARLQIRDQEPGNPTWLAYALYGDPNAKVTFG